VIAARCLLLLGLLGLPAHRPKQQTWQLQSDNTTARHHHDSALQYLTQANPLIATGVNSLPPWIGRSRCWVLQLLGPAAPRGAKLRCCQSEEDLQLCLSEFE
jgi:hypothetical protein